MKSYLLSLVALCALALPAVSWQDQSTSSTLDQRHDQTVDAQPIRLVPHTTKAVDYRQGSESKIALKGTSLMPQVDGEAEVKTRTGRTEIEVHLDHLKPANSLNLTYLTYVLWAVSPDGRPANIGELVVKDDKASIETATPLQAFALIVTAEPYYAVSQPSDQVIAENVIGKETQGWTRGIDVTYELLPREAYAEQVEPIQSPVYGIDKHVPLSLLEARNAVRIAKSANADEYATSALKNAQQLLDQAEDYFKRKQKTTAIDTVAREAVQSAETARVTALRAEEQARLDREREDQERRAEEARAQAARAQAEAQQAQQQAEQEAQQRQQLESQQRAAEAAAEQARQRAELEAQQRAAAEAAQQQAQLQAQQAQQAAQQAQQQAQQAQQQAAQTRARLLSQLNQVLETRDTARGLVVNMPDVLFDTAKAELRPTARERLAKVAGILLAYPDIQVEVDGYTDSTGTQAFNQQLSEQRADSVRNYLMNQGVAGNSVTTRGFGEDNPVASNDTAAGRQQNRRVELVVSGQSIGAEANGQGGNPTR